MRLLFAQNFRYSISGKFGFEDEKKAMSKKVEVRKSLVHALQIISR